MAPPAVSQLSSASTSDQGTASHAREEAVVLLSDEEQEVPDPPSRLQLVGATRAGAGRRAVAAVPRADWARRVSMEGPPTLAVVVGQRHGRWAREVGGEGTPCAQAREALQAVGLQLQ